MLKSPEQYLSGFDFTLEEKGEAKTTLNSGEKAFVEKYLGLDALEKMPLIEPERQLQPIEPAPLPAKTAFAPPQILVAPPKIEVRPAIAPAEAAPKVIAPPPKPVRTAPEPVAQTMQKQAQKAAPPLIAAPVREVVVAPPKPVREIVVAPAKVDTIEKAEAAAQSELVSLKDQLKKESEIQLVSFFVEGQLFLLPVAAIQEVLRHMELVKVPKSPDYVAGAINLRGRVTPVIYLSQLLTRKGPGVYSDSKFIIICGSENLQLGLIIDRINSMHMLAQDKIIWNAESKLGDAAEYLLAIANLDDRVCGIVAPEIITQKLLAP